MVSNYIVNKKLQDLEFHWYGLKIHRAKTYSKDQCSIIAVASVKENLPEEREVCNAIGNHWQRPCAWQHCSSL